MSELVLNLRCCFFHPTCCLAQIKEECAKRSVGTTSAIVNAVVQNLIEAECALSSPTNWPEDFGPAALKQGYLL